MDVQPNIPLTDLIKKVETRFDCSHGIELKKRVNETTWILLEDPLDLGDNPTLKAEKVNVHHSSIPCCYRSLQWCGVMVHFVCFCWMIGCRGALALFIQKAVQCCCMKVTKETNEEHHEWVEKYLIICKACINKRVFCRIQTPRKSMIE